jgi:hypothetical protein
MSPLTHDERRDEFQAQKDDLDSKALKLQALLKE